MPRRGSSENRRERTAGRAPRRPEIDDRQGMIVDGFREIIRRDLEYARCVVSDAGLLSGLGHSSSRDLPAKDARQVRRTVAL